MEIMPLAQPRQVTILSTATIQQDQVGRSSAAPSPFSIIRISDREHIHPLLRKRYAFWRMGTMSLPFHPVPEYPSGPLSPAKSEEKSQLSIMTQHLRQSGR